MSDEKSRPTVDAASLQAVKEPGGPITTPIIQPDNDKWAAALARAFVYILSSEWIMEAKNEKTD